MPDDRQLLFAGPRVWQRQPGEDWEPFEQEILECAPIPENAVVEQMEIQD